MLTEVDTRNTPDGEVSLFMDTDAQVYLVCVEGHEPITCLTRDRALNAYRHPYVYLPLEGAVSPPNGTGGSSPSPESVEAFRGLDERTAFALVELKKALEEMNDADYCWTLRLLGEITDNMTRARRQDVPKPYDHETDGEDVEW